MVEGFLFCLGFVWRQSEFAFFGALTSVGAPFCYLGGFSMKRKIVFLILLLFLLLIIGLCITSCDFSANTPGSLSQGTNTESKELNAQEIYEAIAPSVVTINAFSSGEQSSGTGFFINDGGTIVTNYHVIKNCTTAFATLATGEEYKIEKVLGYSEKQDIAILKISYTNGKPLETRETEIKTGEKVYAIGNSLGFLSGSLSEGIVSTAAREIEGKSYIQTTAAVTHGNSGGPLIDTCGKVIGIISAGFGEGLDLNLAIPISQVESIDVSNPKTLEEIAHIYQSPQFAWVEVDTGFNVTATFHCSCGESKTITTFVPDSDYILTENASQTLFTFKFSATVTLEGRSYTDTRYIKYEYQTISLNKSNYKEYLSVSCGQSGWGVGASVYAKKTDVNYSGVSVRFDVTVTGKWLYDSNNMFAYVSYPKIIVGLNEEKSISLDTQVYGMKVTYAIGQVSGTVSKMVRTAYLTQG